MTAIEPICEIEPRGTPEIFLLTRRAAHGHLGADVRPRGDGQMPAIGKPFVRRGSLAVRIEGRTEEKGERRVDSGDCIAADPAMLVAILDAALYAQSEAPVLIEGETGVGKEILARWIHANSPRGREPWEAINCATLTGELADSELFGHEAGAFTGATRRHVGLLERAARGTVLLDELGELPSSVQAHLLRTLEAGEFRRVGGERMIPLRARILAATHRDLDEATRSQGFRADLLHRLGVLRLRIPPLRERPADIPWLARAIADTLPDAIPLTPDFLERLSRHPWPGNVRELRNVLIRAAVLGSQSVLERTPERPSSRALPPEQFNVLQKQRDQTILQELVRHRGHRGRTHQSLGIPRSTFYRWMQTHQLEVDAALMPPTTSSCGG